MQKQTRTPFDFCETSEFPGSAYARKTKRKDETMETVVFDGEDGSELEFGILEQTRVGGVDYLLVIDPDESENENGSAAYILKDISEDGDKDSCYVFVEDDTEYDAVYKVFAAMLEDIEFE